MTPGKLVRSMFSVLKNCGFVASLITLLLGTDDVQTVLIGGFYKFPAEYFFWYLIMVPKCIPVSVF